MAKKDFISRNYMKMVLSQIIDNFLKFSGASDSKLVGFKRNPRRRGGERGSTEREPRAPEICKESLSGI